MNAPFQWTEEREKRMGMRYGIAVVGGNGSGKTTLGRRLADLLGYRHMDIEKYCFPEPATVYANPLPSEEVKKRLLADIKRYERFVLSSVGGDFGEEINLFYSCAVYIQAPLAVRLARVKQRLVDQFGSRVLKGGDLYQQEQRFFQFVATRTMEKTEGWLKRIGLPVICVDGTQPVEKNAEWLKAEIQSLLQVK